MAEKIGVVWGHQEDEDVSIQTQQNMYTINFNSLIGGR